MIISIVVAAAENNAIGKDNQLLWNLPNDMKFFKNITWGLPVIMGRKTFEALGKPLPGRTNIVITRKADFVFDKVITTGSLEEAIEKTRELNFKEAAIIGGGEIYKQAIGIANVIYITRVHASFNDADTFFPEINEAEWELVSIDNFEKDEKHTYSFSFQKWIRK